MKTEIKPLFAYLKSSPLDEAALAAAEKAGYVPIAVDSFDDFKVIEPALWGNGAALAKAAFSTISEAGYESVRADFGKRAATVLRQ